MAYAHLNLPAKVIQEQMEQAGDNNCGLEDRHFFEEEIEASVVEEVVAEEVIDEEETDEHHEPDDQHGDDQDMSSGHLEKNVAGTFVEVLERIVTIVASAEGNSAYENCTNMKLWMEYTGLRVKILSPQELEDYKQPFLRGWKRELVLRGTVTNTGKKIGDVYYFYPEKKVKLRSHVEMSQWVKKNPSCGLTPDNFTFARQPVYEPPGEVVRPAMTRGVGNQWFPDSESNGVVSPVVPELPPAPQTKSSPVPNRSPRRQVLIPAQSPVTETPEATTLSADLAPVAEGRCKSCRGSILINPN